MSKVARTDDKLAFYPWYVRDFAADELVLMMNLEEEGAYRRILDHQWLHGSVPTDIAALARICKGVGKTVMRRIWLRVGPAFTPCGEGRAANAKMERVRDEHVGVKEAQSDAGRHAANMRWTKERALRSESDDDTRRNAPASIPHSDRSAILCQPESESELDTTTLLPPARKAVLFDELPGHCHDALRIILENSGRGADGVVMAIRRMYDPKTIPTGPGMTTATVEEVAEVVCRMATAKDPGWSQPFANGILTKLRRPAATTDTGWRDQRAS